MKAILAYLFLALSISCAHAVDFGASAVEVELVSGGHGSGVYIGNNYVLTAGHVVQGETSVTIKKPRGGTWVDSWAADVVWVNTVQDFALLRVKAVLPEDTAKSALNCTLPKLQQDVMIVGWPQSLGVVVTRGYIAAGEGTEKRGDWAHSYIVVGAIAPGNSGGPVYDTDGKVLAIAVGILRSNPAIGIIVPVANICSVLPKLE